MPRAEAVFTVFAPEKTGNGPALALADSLFQDSYVPRNEWVVRMPDEVNGRPLEKGMRLKGMGHIFMRTAEEVRPHELIILEKASPPATLTGGWD